MTNEPTKENLVAFKHGDVWTYPKGLHLCQDQEGEWVLISLLTEGIFGIVEWDFDSKEEAQKFIEDNEKQLAAEGLE